MLTSIFAAAIAAAAPAAAAAAPQPTEVFAIGTIDGKPGEFALAPDGWGRYTATFREGVRFRVGKDDSSKAFPFIHPGPIDAWGGSTRHAFRIEFDVAAAPAGPCLLVIGICRSHYAHPPTFVVHINDKHPRTFSTIRDGGEQKRYYIIPAGAIRAGTNAIVIASQTGSWFHYDGLRLLAYPGGSIPEDIGGLQVQDTIFFREADGGTQQVLRVVADGIWDGRGTFAINAGGKTFTVDAEAAAAGETFDIGIPPVEKETPVEVELRTAGGLAAKGSCVARPHRRWRVYVAMKTHYDIGYTEPMEEMLARASGNMLDLVYEYCDRGRGNAPGRRFSWTYPTWLIDEILARKDEEGKKRFEEYIARDEIVWNAMPFSIHTFFCGIEDACRSIYGSKELERRYGKSVAWGKQTDVPGHTRILPQILARSGVRLFQIGANNGVRGVRAPLVFWWESPDGSRVLTQLTPGYGWEWNIDLLSKLEDDPTYPYDAFLALYVTGDNVGPGDLIRVAAEAEEIGRRYAYPKIQIGHVEEFTDWMETKYADKIPVVRTELADWWIHGVASQAMVSALARWAREALTWSERFHAGAALAGIIQPREYPAARFREAYIQSLLYSEHTWGIAGFKPEPKPAAEDDLAKNPDYDPMKESWRIKGDGARRAAAIAKETLDRITGRIARAAAPKEGALVVLNPTSWARTDAARIPKAEVPNATASFEPIGGGSASRAQIVGDEIVFIVRDVPAVGCLAFKPADDGAPAAPERSRARSIQSPFYTLAIDEKGEVTSIVHKATGRELLDPKAPFPFSQYVYEGYEKIEGVGWHGSPYKGKGTGKLVPRTVEWIVESGPVCDRLVVRGTLQIPGFPVQIGETKEVVRTVTVWKDLDRIDCEVSLIGKTETAVAEAGHVAFPFGIPDGKFRLELLGAVTDPVADIQEAGNRDTYSVQHWIDVADAKGGVTWATIDAPIVSLGDIRIFSWDAGYVPARSHIYSSVLNNGWSTNFQEFQGGDFRFRFALRGHAGAEPEARFGWEVASPLLVRQVLKGEGKLGPATSFFEVGPANVVLVNAKRAEDGKGWVIRLFETAGKRTEARIRCGAAPAAARAAVVRMTEEAPPEGAKPLAVEGGAIRTSIGPFEIQTIRIGS